MLKYTHKPGSSRLSVFFVALVIALLAAVMVHDDAGNYFELKLWCPVATDVQLFYDIGQGIGEDYQITHTSGGKLETLKFPLPANKIKEFRLDPISGEGSVFLQSAQIMTKNSKSAVVFPLEFFIPVNHIARMSAYKGGVLIETAPGGNDPFLMARLAEPLDLRPSFPVDFLPALFAFFLVLVISYPLLTVIVVKWEFLLASAPVKAACDLVSFFVSTLLAAKESIRLLFTPKILMIKRIPFIAVWLNPLRTSALVSLAVFLIIAGSRLWLVAHYGNELPLFDQWSVEGAALYKPYLAGNFNLASLWAPCNEHRIVFTRLLAMALFIANGQWDANLQMVVNALLYALIGSGLTLMFSRKLYGFRSLAVSFAIALLFSLPVGYENTLWGFQSHFYLLIGFSLAAVWFLTESVPMSVSWLAGCFLALCALLTMGSGVLAPFAVLLAIVISKLGSGLTCKEYYSKYMATLMVSFALLLLFVLMMPAGAGENRFKVNSLVAFFNALQRCAGWPNPRLNLWALVNWFPFLLFFVFYFRKESNNRSATALFTLTIGFWAFGQEVATSYTRNNLVMVSKYLDLYLIALLANIFAMMYCFSRLRSRTTQNFARMFFCIWLVGNTAGIYLASTQAMGSLAVRNVNSLKQVENVSAFLANGNISMIKQGLTNRYQIPMDIRMFEHMLSDPVIRSILPGSVQHALRPDERKSTGQLSIAARQIAECSVPILLAGIMLLPLIILLTLLQHLQDPSRTES